MNKLKTIKPESLPVIGSVFACLFWFVDSAISTYVFKEHHLFVESLLAPNMVELWSRGQVVFLLMVFSLLSMMLLRRQIDVTRQLSKYKQHLEKIVDERTNDLRERNSQLKKEIRERQIAQAELARQATIDHLTSIPNRRKFNEVLSYELMRDERYRNGLSLVICDLDKFKNINDQYGHYTGDMVLKAFTKLVSRNIRASDIFARWGGEEFVLLLPETRLETAIEIAEKLRIETEKHMFPAVGHVTSSFGVTQYLDGDNEATLIRRADEALYKAKDNGRNMVETHPPMHILQRSLWGWESEVMS